MCEFVDSVAVAAELPGDLVLGHPVHLGGQGEPLLVGELLVDDPMHCDQQLRAERRTLRPQGLVGHVDGRAAAFILETVERHALPPLFPYRGLRHADGDGQGPTHEPTPPGERFQAVQHFQERLLHRVLKERIVHARAPRQRAAQAAEHVVRVRSASAASRRGPGCRIAPRPGPPRQRKHAIVKADHEQEPRIGLGGYCPVCILDANKWAKGSPEHQATYDGVTYYFPEEAIKEKFLANPAKYVPALGGDCIVCYAKLGKRVPGSVNHTARYDNRLFLFPGAEQQQAFLSNPKEFANVDLALNGDCAVCQVHANKRVAGKPEFTEIKDGFRYQFVSAREQAAFRKDPAALCRPGFKAEGHGVADEPTTRGERLPDGHGEDDVRRLRARCHDRSRTLKSSGWPSTPTTEEW